MILALLLAAAAPAAAPAAAAPAAPPSADAVEARAAMADPPESGQLWATAGNLRLKDGDSAGAVRAFERALAVPGMTNRDRGEVLLDRARVAETAGDIATATARAAEASRLVPKDPFVWYFRTVLAVRAGDVPLAKIAIARALALAPDDPTLLFEQGHVAQLAGEDAAARTAWTRAATVDPNGKSGAAARRALALAGVPLTVRGGTTSPAAPEAP